MKQSQQNCSPLLAAFFRYTVTSSIRGKRSPLRAQKITGRYVACDPSILKEASTAISLTNNADADNVQTASHLDWDEDGWTLWATYYYTGCILLDTEYEYA